MINTLNISDEKLVETITNKDKEKYSEIIKRYQKKLMRYASYIMGNELLGSEVVQETFIKAYINLNGFDLKKKFSSWIYRIAHNEAMDMLKRRKNQQPMDEKTDYDGGVDIEDEFVKKEIIRHAHSCLEKIPMIYKEPLSLFYLEDKTYEEISDILRIPIGTVGTRVNRAKGLMKKICQKHLK